MKGYINVHTYCYLCRKQIVGLYNKENGIFFYNDINDDKNKDHNHKCHRKFDAKIQKKFLGKSLSTYPEVHPTLNFEQANEETFSVETNLSLVNFCVPNEELFEDSLIEIILEEERRQCIIEELKMISPLDPTEIEYFGIRFSRDIRTIALLKILRDFKCQICSTKIKKQKGYYIEAAHITPKSEKGPETPDNILILCPNHHKEFDYGVRKITKYPKESPEGILIFLLNGKEYSIDISLK